MFVSEQLFLVNSPNAILSLTQLTFIHPKRAYFMKYTSVVERNVLWVAIPKAQEKCSFSTGGGL